MTILVAGQSVPVIATEGVTHVIRDWDARKEQQWKPVFKDEWPAQRTFPDRELRDGESVAFGGIRLTVHDLGRGESHSDSYWVASDDRIRVAFIGDLAFNGVHSYMTDGHSKAWLENLERVRPLFADVRTLYPGYGAAGGLELLDAQRRFLEKYRETVRRLAAGQSRLTDAQTKQLSQIMESYLPGAKLTFLIPLGANPVASELLDE